MKCSRRLSPCSFLSTVACCCLTLLCGDLNADEPTWRDLVLEDLAEGEASGLAEAFSLAKPVKHSVAFQYRVLLWSGRNQQQPVDPRLHKFDLGDRIRIEVQPVGDAYIYVFNKGTSGRIICLLPREGREPELVRANTKVVLPDNGLIRFGPPAGKEELVVVASEQPIQDLAGFSGGLFDAKATATLESLRARQSQMTTYRALKTDEEREVWKQIRQKAGQEKPAQVTIETPADAKTGSILAAQISTDEAPNLYISIPLESTGSQ